MGRSAGLLVRASRRAGSGRGTAKASAAVRFLRKSGRSKDCSPEIPPPKARIAKSSCSAGFGRNWRAVPAAGMSGSPSAAFM